METIRLLLDDHRGIYLPRDFIECFSPDEWHISKEDAEYLSKGPDQEWYDDVWLDVLDTAYYEADDGYTWVLYQDGALFAVRDDHDWEEEEC